MTEQHTQPIDILPLVGAAFAALDDAGLGWVVLREHGALSATAGDIDVLVAAAGAKGLDALLATAGYRRLPGAGQGSHRFYLGYDVERDTWVTLDLVTEVAFGRRLEFLTTAAPSFFVRASRSNGVNVLDPDDRFWHLLLHYLLDKPHVPRSGHERLARAAAAASEGGPLAAIVDDLRPAGLTAAEVLSLVRCGDTGAIESLSTPMRRAWRSHDRPRVWARVARSWSERVHLVGSDGPRRTGMSVAILGPDGAGKTTLARGLAASVPLPSRQLYMGVWREYPWDRWLRWMPGARLAARLARLATRSAQSRYHRMRGRLVLLDRFTYDAALPQPDFDWRGRVTAAVTRRLATDPDLVLVLDAPAEVMYGRKGEQGTTVLARDRAAYLRLAAAHRSAAVIDAAATPAMVRARAHEALWQVVRRVPTVTVER